MTETGTAPGDCAVMQCQCWSEDIEMATAPVVEDPQSRVEHAISRLRAAWLKFGTPVLTLTMRQTRDASRSVTDDACWRIRADFEEMPDLTVTTRQAARFWAIDEHVAAAALQHLEERGILRQTRLGFRRS
jgi:hypothetical protein